MTILIERVNYMVDISIIVPVYKVEKYLFRCVNSLIDQTCKNFEIILVKWLNCY